MSEITITARGCNYNRYRQNLWDMIRDCIERNGDESYIQLQADKKNEYDPNAIVVMCRGEFYGTMGYVAKEQTDTVRQFLKENGWTDRSIGSIKVAVEDLSEIGGSNVRLRLSVGKKGE